MIRLIILVVIAVIILGYFGFSIENIITSPQVQSNLTYIKNIGLDIFYFIVNYLKLFIIAIVDFITGMIQGGTQ